MKKQDGFLDELLGFVIEEHIAGYASDNKSNWVKESDGSTSIRYEKGEWEVHDNFFGGEPYGGREVVFHKGYPVWMMVYYGAVSETEPNLKEIYQFLQKALKACPKNNPYRGPKEFIEGSFVYRNSPKGKIVVFSGKEEILKNGKVVYWAKYEGGLVDQKKE